MRATQDFNYKVALGSGLRSLQAGRLREAEEQFRYLTQKFPSADGGYRGLAKVQLELEDRAAALATLRAGAAACARDGERAPSIALLREAVGLDGRDLTSHRHLAAALALDGKTNEAVQEYARYAQAQLDAGDTERARIEVTYALETLSDPSALDALAQRLEVGRTVPAARTTVTPSVAAEPEAVVPERSSADREDHASVLLASGDPGAAQAALEAARAHLAEGRNDAASDLLLQLVAAGTAPHDAQLLLVDVANALGQRDVAKAKVGLLAEALRLEGRHDLASEIERLAAVV
ncbi:MAG: hypothetical protein HY071_02460 [Chloroflexi bacterium]|nr:hypothetical protein [Chloroflexota bacterium]